MQITSKDQALLNILQLNARATITEIARQLGVSRSTAQKRLERLEQADVIDGYTIRLSQRYLDKEIKANVLITVRSRDTGEIIKKMNKFDEVKTVYSVSGQFDLIAEIAAMDISRLDWVIDQIIEINGVERTESSIILSTRLKR